MKKSRTVLLCMSAVFAAMVTALTMLHLPVPAGSGYVHVGDSMIFLASCILPFPYSLFACGIGGAFADALFGFWSWAPFTLVIKMLNTLPFALCFYKNRKKDKIIFTGSVISAVISSLITFAGYFFASVIMYSFSGAVAEIFGNVIQAAAGTVIFILVGLALDAAKIKKRISFKGDKHG